VTDGYSNIEALCGAFYASRVLHTAVELDLFAAIGDGGNAAQVAARRGLNERATMLMLNAATAIGLLRKRNGVFSLTDDTRRYLLPDSAEYFGGMVAFEGASWPLWERLGEAVRTGQPVRRPDMYQNDADETRRFILAMHSLVRARGDDRWLADHLPRLIPLDGPRRLLDVGSGPATYPIALARALPELDARVFDLPATLTVTAGVVQQEDMGDRIALHSGDYRSDPLPGGCHVVFMSNVLHGEDEATCRTLIHNSFDALQPGGHLVIKDHVLNGELTAPEGGALFSLLMLLSTRGRDYGLHEMAEWMDAAGFAPPVETVLPSPFSSSLVIARKPD